MLTSIRTYPLRLDDNVVRAVASLTFFTAIVMLLRPDFRFLIYLLFIDFTLRYIHPKVSPVAQGMKFINVRLLNNKPIFKFAPPKRFAILIGVIITGGMTLFQYFAIEIGFMIFLSFLILASGLQSWFDYCLGCTLYDQLVKAKILGRGQNYDDFMKHLDNLSNIGEISHDNIQGAIDIQDELYRIAIELDGTLSEEENVMLSQISHDLHEFVNLLNQALEDGVITSDEKKQLLKESQNIASNTYDMTSTSARAKTYLVMVQDYIDHLNRRLLKN